MAMNRRIAVVGLGSIGRRHARLLAARADLEVEWCEAAPEAIARARAELPAPVRLHPSFDALLATEPSMIVIATPHAAHAAQAIQALHLGVHVLCEKPMSDSIEAAEAVALAARQSAATFAIGFQLHFHPGILRLKRLIETGELGSIHHLHCRVGTYVTLVNSASRYQERLEGALFMDYAHQPDLFYWLLGRAPQGVYAAGRQGGGLPLQSNPNVAAVICDYDGPLISTTHLNYLQVPERQDLEVVGDRGWASLDLLAGSLRVGRQVDASETWERFPTERDPLYVREHQAFLDAVAGLRPPESSAEDALVSMRVIEAALASLRNGRRQPLHSA